MHALSAAAREGTERRRAAPRFSFCARALSAAPVCNKEAGRPSAGGSLGGPLGCMARGSHEAAPDCMASGAEAMQSDNVTAAVLLHPAVWPSRRPGEMPPEQGHVAPIGTEEDVADRTG